MKSSRWKRYDAKSGLWIQSNKRIYVYWFKFLQHAENDSNRQVDWSSYEGWGGADEFDKDDKFDAWWRKRWKTLFGYKLGETEPLYGLNNKKPQPDGVRYSLLVYELKDKPLLNGQVVDEVNGIVGDYWEIAKRIAVKEYPKRREKGKKDKSYKPEEWGFNIARKSIARELRKTNPVEFNKKRRTVQSRVGRYMRSAKNHLDSVCEGRFPYKSP